MNRPVALIRRFVSISGHYKKHEVEFDDLWGVLGRGERLVWGQLRDRYRVVLLAEAGAGKTYELKAEAERMVKGGAAAFFIRIEDIDAQFGDAFEVGSEARFSAWLKHAEEEAWFFLDSVDEVRLETPRSFENALRAFADRIRNARQRAHVFISSRPYAWRSKLDSALIKDLLPFDPPQAEAEDRADEDGVAIVTPTRTGADDEEDSRGLSLFQLAPLDDDDIRLFAGQRGVIDTDAFLDALKRLALLDMARRPFDLEDLAAIWQETGSLDSRLAVVERGLHRRLSPSPGYTGSLRLDRALDGARRLALATTLTSESNIRLPGSSEGGLDAATLLDDWSAPEVGELLGRGAFNDPVYSMVRFRHRETRELLAAQHLAAALPAARAEVEGLIFKDIYDEAVIVPRLRSLLPWLILFDEQIRTRALALDPSIGFEGGDPARLPYDVRRDMLHDIVQRIASGDLRGPDNEQIARIAQPDLATETLARIETYHAQEEVIFFLGRLVWQGAMTEAAERLVPIALDPARSVYSRIVVARAAGTVLGADALLDLWTRLNASGEILPRRLVAELLDVAPTTSASVATLSASFDHVEAGQRFKATGLGAALHSFVDRLPDVSDRAPDQPLRLLLEGLATFLAQGPFVERRECKVSSAFVWLMPVALHVVERLVIGRSAASLSPSALEALHNRWALRHWGGGEEFSEYKTRLGELVPRWIELNDALFWHAVDAARAALEDKAERVTDDWTVSRMGQFWAFDDASFPRTLAWIKSRPFLDDRLVALSRSFRTYVASGRTPGRRRALWRAVRGEATLEDKLSQLMRPPPSQSAKKWRSQERQWSRKRRQREEENSRARTALITRLKADPDLVRAPPGLAAGQISNQQFFLLQSIEGDGVRLSRRAGARWRSLIPEFGEAVAEAFRDGAVRQWRAYTPPLMSEGGNRMSIPYALIFAMAGLEIEAGEDGRGLLNLAAAEAEHALRYAVWELNGFPPWFETLYRAFPEVGFKLIWGETRWALANAAPDQPMHYMLHDLVYHAPWLHIDLAEPIRVWVHEHGAVNDDVLRYSRTIMVGGRLKASQLAELARARLTTPQTPAVQRPSWFGLWVDADADAAIPALEAELGAQDRSSATRFAELFAVNLVGGRRESFQKLGTWRTIDHLKALYVLMHQYIRVEEDIDRADGGVYSPELRDDAQDARSQLFSLLADIPGEAAYRAILALAEEHPEPDYRTFMRQKAHDRAVADSDQVWSFDAILDLEKHWRAER